MTAQRTLRRAVSDEDKQQRRDEILAAAKLVFAEKGYHDTTIADVARGTGLSYGVVYWYFDSKDELYQALMELEEARLRSQIDLALRGAGPLRGDGGIGGILRASVAATFEFFDDDRASTLLAFEQPRSGPGDEIQRRRLGILERFVDDLEALIRRAQRDHGLRAAPPRLIAVSIASLIAQLALRRLHTDDGLTAAEAADVLVDLVLDGLRPRGRSKKKVPLS